MRSLLHSAALVSAWLDTLRPEQREIAERLRDAVLAASPELETGVRWGNLIFTRHGTHALAIAVHRTHVHLQVFNGHLLAARFRQLEGGGKAVRHLRLTYRYPFDPLLVRELVQACVRELPEDERRRAA
jgi:uncharacterized protein YdhG (YjbR/CyaY superfamily)